MSDSTPIITQLTPSQAGKEVTVNHLFGATSHAATFGFSQSSSGLSFDYFGGRLLVDGVSTAIANGTVILTASNTNYVEATRAGVVSANITGFTAGSIALYKVVAGASTITSYEDHRPWTRLAKGKLAKVMGSDANITLTHAEALNDILIITSGVSLSATRDVILPLAVNTWIVKNSTTGGQSLQFIGSSGTGVTVANGAVASIYSDGTNISMVAGGTGSVITNTDDLAEGVTNLYFTDVRALAAAPAETIESIGDLINGATDKNPPVDADYVGLMDSADNNDLKKLSWANIKAAIKSYLDSFYAPIEQPFIISGDIGDSTTPLTATQSLQIHKAGVTFTLPSGLANSSLKARTAATASTIITLWKDASSIGTATFGVGGTDATIVFSSDVTFTAGTHEFKLTGPGTPDATLAGLYWTILGSR